MYKLTNERTEELKPNSHVRIINEQKTIGKKRFNLSKDDYIVDSKVKNKYILRIKDKIALLKQIEPAALFGSLKPLIEDEKDPKFGPAIVKTAFQFETRIIASVQPAKSKEH